MKSLSSISRVFLLLAFCLGGGAGLYGQEENSAEEPTERAEATSAIAETTASNPSIREDVLLLRLLPLTVEEISSEANAWQELLQEKTSQISALEIEYLTDEAGTKVDTKISSLREEKLVIVSRFATVLDAWELKGGDAVNSRKYLSAVRGVTPSQTGLGFRLKAFKTWVTSQEGGRHYLILTAKFVGILIVGWIIGTLTSKVIHRALEKQEHISELLRNFINKMSQRVILLIALIIALGSVGVNVGAALALIGGGAFILAFALQDTLSNFAAGIMLLIYRPFDVGDAVTLNDLSGTVDSVSMVSTTLRTFDNQKVLIPNNKVWGETITNITGMPNRRVDMIFSIGYDDDADLAQEILEKIVAEHPLTLEIPEPAIHLHELADSSVNFICRPWAKTADHWAVYWAITKRVKKEFDAAGLSIPFPQQDVHVYQKTFSDSPQKASSSSPSPSSVDV